MDINSYINSWVEGNWLPDWLLRKGIRRLTQQRLIDEDKHDPEKQQEHFNDFLKGLKASPIAVHVDKANEQHYEVPPEFFSLVLGKNLKYSCCYFKPGVTTLEEAEEDMLNKYIERARIEDGQTVLELGCGWGSLSLYLARRFPNAKIVGLSNSSPQRQYITQKAAQLGLTNLRIDTADVSDYQPKEGPNYFDRVVSIEMFEHMKNYDLLLKKIASWLKPTGLLFVHIFSHIKFAYHFNADDSWMAKYFFTGGTMPSDNLLMYFQEDLHLIDHWVVNGTHYGKTSAEWLRRMDEHKTEITKIFEKTYGAGNVTVWWVRWRLFFMACEEFFNINNGNDFVVSHYLFQK